MCTFAPLLGWPHGTIMFINVILFICVTLYILKDGGTEGGFPEQKAPGTYSQICIHRLVALDKA